MASPYRDAMNTTMPVISSSSQCLQSCKIWDGHTASSLGHERSDSPDALRCGMLQSATPDMLCSPSQGAQCPLSTEKAVSSARRILNLIKSWDAAAYR